MLIDLMFLCALLYLPSQQRPFFKKYGLCSFISSPEGWQLASKSSLFFSFFGQNFAESK